MTPFVIIFRSYWPLIFTKREIRLGPFFLLCAEPPYWKFGEVHPHHRTFTQSYIFTFGLMGSLQLIQLGSSDNQIDHSHVLGLLMCRCYDILLLMFVVRKGTPLYLTEMFITYISSTRYTGYKWSTWLLKYN